MNYKTSFERLNLKWFCVWYEGNSLQYLDTKHPSGTEISKRDSRSKEKSRSFPKNEHAKNELENIDLKTKYETMQKSLQDTKAQIKTMEQKLISKNSEVRYFNLYKLLS